MEMLSELYVSQSISKHRSTSPQEPLVKGRMVKHFPKNIGIRFPTALQQLTCQLSYFEMEVFWSSRILFSTHLNKEENW